MTISRLRTTFRLTPRVMAELSPHHHGVEGLRQRQHQEEGRGTRQSSRGRSSHSALPRPPSIQKVASRTAASSGAV